MYKEFSSDQQKYDIYDHINLVESLESLVDSPISKQGFLQKYSRKGYFRNWKKRFFVLSSGYLYYYESSSWRDSQMIGVNLRGQMSLINARVSPQSNMSKLQIYILGGNGERDLIIQTSKVDWNVWINLIREHCEYATFMYNKYSNVDFQRNVSFHRFMSICSEVAYISRASIQSNHKMEKDVNYLNSIERKVEIISPDNIYGHRRMIPINDDVEEIERISIMNLPSADISSDDEKVMDALPPISSADHPNTSSGGVPEKEEVQMEKDKRDGDEKSLLSFLNSEGFDKSDEYQKLTLQERLQLALLQEEADRKNKFLSFKQEKLNLFLNLSSDGQTKHHIPLNVDVDGPNALSLSQRLRFLRDKEEKEKAEKLENDKKLKLSLFLSPEAVDPRRPDEAAAGSVKDRFENAKLLQKMTTEQRVDNLKMISSPTIYKNNDKKVI